MPRRLIISIPRWHKHVHIRSICLYLRLSPGVGNGICLIYTLLVFHLIVSVNFADLDVGLAISPAKQAFHAGRDEFGGLI